MYINVEQLKKEISMVDVLEKYLGVTAPKGRKQFNILCPFHDDHHPSFGIDTRRNLVKCFAACEKMGDKALDIISLTEKIYNIDFKTALNKLANDFSVESETSLPKTKRTTLDSWKEPLNKVRNYNNLYKTLSKDYHLEKPLIIENNQYQSVTTEMYFLTRGISNETAEEYGLGIVTDQTDLCGFTDREKALLKFYKFIIPISDQFFVARLDETKAIGAKYRNFGRAELLNKQYIGDTTKTFVFVVEGVFDALAIEDRGFYAISLNSASNASLLLKEIQRNEDAVKEQQYILLADHDKAGKILEEKLQKSFDEMNMYIHISLWYEKIKGFNDISALASSKPNTLGEALQSIIMECINRH